MSEEEPEKYKTISIRGVNSDIYEQFSNKIKMMEMNLGEALSKLMEDVINTFDDEFPDLSASALKLSALGKLSISHHRDIRVTKEDLVGAERAVAFEHCRNLEFAPDVDKDTFLSYVKSISHSRGVRIPNMASKLVLLSRIQFCEDVEFYEIDG